MGTKFELTDQQHERVIAWSKEHAANHSKGPKDVSGAYLRFTFIPTGLGINASVNCLYCGKEINITEDFDTGEFMFDNDGKLIP